MIPTTSIVYAIQPLLVSGSDDVRPNASSGSPVDAEWTVPSNEVWHLESISCFLNDNGTTNPDRFGAIISGLTNGIQLQLVLRGTTFTTVNIQNNMHLQLIFSDNNLVPSTSGLFETSDIFCGTLRFENPIKLVASDIVRARCRDNLTSLDQLKFFARVWRQLT